MPVVPGVPGANLPPGDDAIIRRIQELERAVREMLPAVMAAVGPAITTLQNQQTQLSNQLASINALIGAQVTFGSVGASATGFTPGAAADLAGSVITVPSGYSQAIVHCTADATASAEPNSASLTAQAVIAGAAGGSASTLDTTRMTASPSAIRSFTGLSGGTISVAVRVSGSGTGWLTGVSIANCNAIAIFLR